jgi:hypothetical protein
VRLFAVFGLLIASSQIASSAAIADTSIREARRLSVATSPDFLVLHADLNGWRTASLLGLRLTVNLTSRLALTAAASTTPGQVEMADAGLRMNLLDRPLTPYTGVDVGSVALHVSDRHPTQSFALGVLGIGFAASNGLDVALEGGAGLQGRPDEGDELGRRTVIVRVGLRVGFRPAAPGASGARLAAPGASGARPSARSYPPTSNAAPNPVAAR